MQFVDRVKQLFVDTLPQKPYCFFDLIAGLKIRPAAMAMNAPYIQPNSPTSIHWLVIDIDKPNSAFLYETVGLPAPNIVSINRENGHCHYYIKINEVYTSKNARSHPIRYLEAIKQAYVDALGADKSYSGLISKNPIDCDTWLNLYITERKRRYLGRYFALPWCKIASQNATTIMPRPSPSRDAPCLNSAHSASRSQMTLRLV